MAEIYRTMDMDMGQLYSVKREAHRRVLTVVATDECITEGCCHVSVNHFLRVLHRNVHVAVKTRKSSYTKRIRRRW
jgi:hypothetical protein